MIKPINLFVAFIFLFVSVEECFGRFSQAFKLQKINKRFVIILEIKVIFAYSRLLLTL